MTGQVADACEGVLRATCAGDGLRNRFRCVRDETERLARPLSPEDQGLQSMADASPAKWHRAHTTWFFETFVLGPHAAGYQPFHADYGFLFNSYYEAVGPRHARPRRGLLSRPSADDIAHYRVHVDDALSALLEERGDDPEISALVELGLQHEQQHQELLLTDILHAFAQNPLLPAYAPYRVAEARLTDPAGFLAFDGGRITIGHAGAGFAFDNETPRHDVLVQPFSLMDRLVTNGEWLAFITDGGYRDPRLWLSDGWQRAQEEAWSAPLYWHNEDGVWQAMTLAGLKPVELAAPVVHVSYYEADAFARWAGKRLPSEAEWEHAAQSASTEAGNFRENGFLRPLAAHGDQLFGDVWEWTQSPYSPYPGYRAPEGAIGEYNGKFMINQMVLRGGSCVTPRDHMRASYRNFFYPHQRWQFAGLRLAEEAARSRPAVRDEFLDDIRSGFAAAQKTLPSKYFYDAEGSRLFEEICTLPEYYLTRTEMLLLEDVVRDLGDSVKPDAALVEFGCGASLKTRVVLNHLREIALYVPVDICEESLKQSARGIRADYPHVRVEPIAADFMQSLPTPASLRGRPVLGFFPGSTIGNFDDGQAEAFLRASRSLLGPEARLLVGIDLVKDTSVLLPAYDDARGITAAFNLNLLARINGAYGANFDLAQFRHRALWNAEKSRIEMHLESLCEQHIRVRAREYSFRAGETIHTENSHKYTPEGFAAIATRAGWSLERSWIHPSPAYGLILLA